MYDQLIQKLDQLGPPKHQAFEGDSAALREAAAKGVQTKDGVKKWSIANAPCACDKLVPVSTFRVFSTGLVNVVDNVCIGCRSAAKGLSIIVCPRCRAVVARIAPHKDKKTGFVFLPEKCYHVDCCPRCEPEIVVKRAEPTFIFEMLMYMKQNNIPRPDVWKNRRYKKGLIMGASSA